jgi:cold shock protein
LINERFAADERARSMVGEAIVQTERVASSGVVREYHAEEGWGVIDGTDVPGGCWVHFSAIAMDGFRRLVAGQQVSFRAEAAVQDGLTFRAVKVWTGNREPADPYVGLHKSSAYHSSLTLTLDEPGDPGPS